MKEYSTYYVEPDAQGNFWIIYRVERVVARAKTPEEAGELTKSLNAGLKGLAVE